MSGHFNWIARIDGNVRKGKMEKKDLELTVEQVQKQKDACILCV